MRKNLLMNADSYKPSHYLQIPDNTDYISAYIEPRGTQIGGWIETTFFGLQMFVKDYLTEPFTQEDIEEAASYLIPHGVPFNREGWQYILDTHGGHMPVRIQAIPEGTVTPVGNVQVQFINTDTNAEWVSGYLETCAQRAVWFPTSVATQDMYIMRSMRRFADLTSDEEDFDHLMFKLHGFGARSASSLESAAIADTAHLVYYRGTDTLEALRYARVFYHEHMAGFSIPASEHSAIIVWGGEEHEYKAFENMIDKFGGEGQLYAMPIDSYNDLLACDKLYALEEKILAKGGTLVARPDSGEPVDVVVSIVGRLMELFGSTTNSKGFKVLPDHIRVIQGDGVNYKSIDEILDNMVAHKQSIDNIAFGMGGAMTQHPQRDWFKYAMKASAALVDGTWIDISKNPVGDPSKRSKVGILALVKRDGTYQTILESELRDGEENILRDVYLNGELLVDEPFSVIRARAEAGGLAAA